VPKPMDEYRVTDLNPGNVIDEPGNAVVYHTGDWKSQRPVWNEQKCIKCGVCWNFCPDNAIMRKEGGYFIANYEYCKGCGICAHECITQCITMVEEVV